MKVKRLVKKHWP